ncbi:Alpha-L-fucosidase [uncultured Defluviicoccus sp.]|uniref:alpha-L-fucosidase n=1 Tax=metagenome TaxID=256318 RepID=A0A380TFU7_9ZZZZ|nr:Alpha-L-fucosidase [uncultured Defluviicoccus sp.]
MKLTLMPASSLRGIFSAVLVFLTTRVCAETSLPVRYTPQWDSLDQRPCPAWYLDAKFGIFIHWGVYAVPAWGPPQSYSEWYWHNISKVRDGHHEQFQAAFREHHRRLWGEDFAYERFAPMFKAEFFDANRWADLFARSGARYIVPTSKHHDGFCLWPSAEADRAWGHAWNSVSTGPKRDLMGELSEACRSRDLKFGFYYSLYEWFNPLWLADRRRYVDEYMFPQFKDVVSRYKPAIIFSDGEWSMPSKEWRSEELLAWLFNDSPAKDEVVVNDRWGKDTRHKHGTYFTTEYGAGLKDAVHPWEENRGIGFSFGYNRAENIDDYKSARELILILADMVSRGGNLLLDIGPTADGRIPVIMQDRLLEIGRWLGVNGDAIYGTRPAARDCQWSEGIRPGQDFGEYKVKYNLMEQVGQQPRGKMAVKQAFFTSKADVLYAITPGWPGEKLVLHDVTVPAGTEITLLGRAEPLVWTTQGRNLVINLPQLSGDELPCLHAYSFKLPGAKFLPE